MVNLSVGVVGVVRVASESAWRGTGGSYAGVGDPTVVPSLNEGGAEHG